MENVTTENDKTYKPNHTGRVIAGMVIIVAGLAFLLRQVGFFMPYWLFTWPMLLILLGVYLGARHNFRSRGHIILIAIGAIFLAEEIMPWLNVHRLLFPILIIVAGIFIILNPRRRRWRKYGDWGNDWKNYDWKYDVHINQEGKTAEGARSSEDFLESTTVFGGVKKMVMTKNFKGGEVTNIFGGAEINLTQADIQGKAILEVTQVFGGTTLIVPRNWEIRSEMSTAVMGGIEDKRYPNDQAPDPDKVLVLIGTCVFAGIEIQSY